MIKSIKLMAEYESWPLWHIGDKVGNIDPATLPISEETRHLLERWADMYNAQINLNDQHDVFADTVELDGDTFEHQGIAIWKRLRQELAPDYEISYFSEVWQRVFQQPSELPEQITADGPPPA